MKILIFSLMIAASSCSKESMPNVELPPCIKEMLDQKENQGILRVQTQLVAGVQHYWLNTDARFVDGTEAIVNAECETVCTIGGFRVPPKCAEVYDDQAWEEIYSRPQ